MMEAIEKLDELCKVRIAILTPDHRLYTRPWGAVILLSQALPDLPETLDAARFEKIMEGHGHEWSALMLTGAHERPQVTLWKSITSNYDIYYLCRNGWGVISDIFSQCVLHVPPAERLPSRDALIDHLLFTKVVGTSTYLDAIHRLGHGEKLELDPAYGVVRRSSFQRLHRQWRRRNAADYVDAVHDALQAACDKPEAPDQSLLFSGGVDSTLLATYHEEMPLVTHAITSREFVKETVYARHASQLLGRPLHFNIVEEESFFQRCEDLIDRLGMPPVGAQTILLASTFESMGFRRFICGEIADTLFGWFLHPHGLYGPLLASPLASGIAAALRCSPWKWLRNAGVVAREFSEEPTSPYGFASRAARRMESDTAASMFTRSRIEARLAARCEYVAHIADLPIDIAGRAPHLEVMHLINLFCEESFCVWRQAASCHGKSLSSPFARTGVIKVAMSIPPGDRYMDRRETKYLLKRLLRRRLPAYRTRQQKLGGVLPVARFTTNGPLAEWLQRYDVSDLLDASLLRHMQRRDPRALWQAFTYSVWRKRITSLTAAPPPLLELVCGVVRIDDGGTRLKMVRAHKGWS